MTPETTRKTRALPPEIPAKLEEAGRRIRRVQLLRGLISFSTVTLTLLLAVMAVDAVIMLHAPGIRWVLTLTVFTGIAYSAWHFILRPLRRKRTPAEIARIIESRMGETSDERISSAVEILSKEDGTADVFSDKLLEKLTEGAVLDTSGILPDQLFTLASARKVIRILAVVAGIFLAVFIIWPQGSARLLVRAVAPFSQVGTLHEDRIELEPGDVRIGAGDSLRIEARVPAALSGPVELRTRRRDERELSERLRSTPAREEEGEEAHAMYQHQFPRVREGLEYRVRVGRVLTRWFQVEVFERPEITRMELRSVPPAYTGLEPLNRSDPPGGISLLAGSKAVLTVETGIPVEQAELFTGDESRGPGRPVELNGNPAMTWDLEAGLKELDTDWRVKMISKDGFENSGDRPHPFRVVADQAPEIRIIRPERQQLNLPAGSGLSIEYRVSDDYGISRVVLRKGEDPDAFPERTLPLPEMPGGTEGRGTVPLRLSGFAATKVYVELKVYDNLPPELGGPNVATSRRLTLVLNPEHASLEQQQFEHLTSETAPMLENIISDLERVRDQIRELPDAHDSESGEEEPGEEGVQEPVLRRLESIANDMTTYEEQHRDTLFDRSADDVARIREEYIQEAAEHLRDFSGEQEEMEQMAEQSAGALDQALEQLNEAMREAREQMEQLAQLAEMSELANRQERLAGEAGMDDWLDRQEEWRQEQQALAEALADPASLPPVDPPPSGDPAETDTHDDPSGEAATEIADGADGEQGDDPAGESPSEIADGENGAGEEAPQGEPGTETAGNGEDSRRLAEESANQAAQAQTREDAGEHAREAARHLAQLAQSLQQQMGMESNPFSEDSSPGDSPGEGEVTVPDSGTLHWAAELGISTEEWHRLRGETGRGGDAARDMRVPAEYRGLVRDYFRALGETD